MVKVEAPIIRRVTGPAEKYELMEPYSLALPVVHRDIFIAVGFVFDGGSVPRFFWRISHPQEFPAAYLVHDALYATELLPRMQADMILRKLVKREGGSWLQQYVIYYAVRIFGGFVWRKHRPWVVRRMRKIITLQ